MVRSHLVAEFAATIGGRLADPDDRLRLHRQPADTPFGRRLEITDVLPFSLKRLRALLRERGVGRLEIRKRGSALEPEQLRRDLRLSGPAGGLAGADPGGRRADGAALPSDLTRAVRRRRPAWDGGIDPREYVASMAKKAAAGTPATALLTAQKVEHTLHPYEVSPDAPNYGALVAAGAGRSRRSGSSRHWSPRSTARLVVAVVPVTGDLDLKALAHAVGGKRAALADRAAAERSSGYVRGGISPLGQRSAATVVDDSSRPRPDDVSAAPADLIG